MLSPYVPILGYKGSMRKRTIVSRARTGSALIALLTVTLALVATTATAAERTIVLGADDAWREISRESRVALRPGREGYLDLTLEPFQYEAGGSTELLLGFDEIPLRDASGTYEVRGAPELTRTSQRTGRGALLVDGPEDRLTLVPNAGSAFAPGTEWASFTIEFWLYPVAFYDGDTVLAWRAREGADLDFRTQEVAIEVSLGTIAARFENFFVRPDGEGVSVTLRGRDRLIPREWSHHLFRFDATSGLLEYLVDGSPVDLTHVSRTGRQDGSVYFPRIAAYPSDGIVVADGLVGAIDELRIERRFVEDPEFHEFPPGGGSIVTDFIDLGSSGAPLLRVDASIDAPGLSDVFLYYRLVNLRDSGISEDHGAWAAVRPGTLFPDARGRFVQIRAELYPDTRDGTAPTLSQLAITYEPERVPLPPTALRAIPRDGAVTLEWAASQDPDIDGYLVYYGERPGRYFGVGSARGDSPVNVGAATSVTIDGLRNGTLYFFAVQARSAAGGGERNPLSTEVAARPAKVYE
jgi:hypothetical protein